MHSNGQREGTVVSRGLGDRAWGRQTHNAQKTSRESRPMFSLAGSPRSSGNSARVRTYATLLANAARHLACTPKRMPDRKRFWRVVIPIVLIVLLMTTTLGMVWHNHVNCTPGTCPLCHMAIEPPVAGVGACAMVLAGAGPESQCNNFAARTATRQVPARAPPA